MSVELASVSSQERKTGSAGSAIKQAKNAWESTFWHSTLTVSANRDVHLSSIAIVTTMSVSHSNTPLV
jgi:hypothetical protein